MTTIKQAKEPEKLSVHKFDIGSLKKNGLLENEVKLYVNAFPIQFNKDLSIHEYPFTIKPEINEEYLISKIFKSLSHQIYETYGTFYRSGKSFNSVKEVSEPKEFKTSIADEGKIEYTLQIDKKAKTTTIKKGQKNNFSQIQEQILFLIIREILTTNPNVKVDKDNFYLENKYETIKGLKQTYNIHDGYKISLKQTEEGLCLIIGIKNRVKGDLNVYDALMNKKFNFGETEEERIDNLIGKRFVPEYGTKSKIIHDIDKDRTPMNTTINHGKETYTNYVEFYEKVFHIKIKNKNQPMIRVEYKQSEGETKYGWYVPELCKLIGVNQNDTENSKFMKELAQFTRLEPDKVVKQIDKCIDLFRDETERKPKEEEKKEDKEENKIELKNEIKKIAIYNTSNKKRQFYGIDIIKIKDLTSSHLAQPKFNYGNKKKVSLNKDTEVARLKMNSTNWICLYHKSLEKCTYDLLSDIEFCQKKLGINLKSDDSNWIRMNSDNVKDWEDSVEQKMEEIDLEFVIFFISKENNHLYKELKKFSLCEKGYVSQVINFDKYKDLKKNKKQASYISNILTQINCKLGGANYILNLDNDIKQRDIMFIGIDFGLNASHTWKRREKGVISLIATRDKTFSKFYAQNEILECKGNYILSIQEHISSFIKSAIKKYEKEEKKSPKNIIFYRQGISEYSVENIKSEIKIIEEVCNLNQVNYYYVIVNMKTSLKLFELNTRKTEKERGEYKNPESGLVLLNKITNLNEFEFYLQPQKVTQGSATPTSFHVLYGNMNYPEILIKLTYWTTFIYPNWKNAVRIPHVLKIAEKYSSMTAGVTYARNNDIISDLLSGL